MTEDEKLILHRKMLDQARMNAHFLMLKPVTFKVLSALLHHCNAKSGLCYPAIDTLAAELGLSRETVKRARADLKLSGFIDWSVGYGLPSAKAKCCYYKLWLRAIIDGGTFSLERAKQTKAQARATGKQGKYSRRRLIKTLDDFKNRRKAS